jgi:hypothetical protein
MSAFSLPPAPAVLTVDLPCWRNAPLLRQPTRGWITIHSFGAGLSPVELSAQARLTSELLRTL